MVPLVYAVRRAPVQRQQRRSMATAVQAKRSSEQAEQARPQVQRASDAELRADGLLMLAAAMMPLVLDVEPAAAGNPLLTGKTVRNTARKTCTMICSWQADHQTAHLHWGGNLHAG
jgi:hypothetical protein